jgi:RNA polymerase sigma factor (TIGR02999 family)
MSTAAAGPVTRLLVEWGEGNQEALQALMPLVYDELRGLARRYLRREVLDSLQSAGLVHEAYLKLVDQKRMNWKNRAQFMGVAAQLMRRILVDRARKHQVAKRGAAAVSKLCLGKAAGFPAPAEVDLLLLDDALKSLESLHPQQSRIVEMRFFGGLSIEEVAEALQLSPSTIKRDWAMSKAWLVQQIGL